MIKQIFGLAKRNKKKPAVKFGEGLLYARGGHHLELRGGSKGDICTVKEYISLFEHQAVLDIHP